MSIQVLPVTKETLDSMKGQDFVPQNGEGVVAIKLTFLTPDTIKNGDPASAVENAQGVVVCGQLSEIKDQLAKWFDESAAQYAKTQQEKY